MAIVKIKGRREVINLPDERARQLKNVWLGKFGYTKANPREVIDLDEWVGEFGQIASIEIYTSGAQRENVDYLEQERKDHEAILAIPIEERAKLIAQFKLEWYARSEFKEYEPPEEIKKQAEEISLKFYTENPQAVRVDRELFEPLLAGRFGDKKKSSNPLVARFQ